MLPIHKILLHELTAAATPARVPEPAEAMEDADQVRSYVAAYEWGGPTSALQLHHLRELSRLIRPGGTVLDLACGPGPLILELAPLYPETRFIGADLSSEMLQYLAGEAKVRGLSNVFTLEEDIRALPSIEPCQVDLIISTSALHHLPTEEGLRQVFHRIRSILGEEGAFYLFDFGLLKTKQAQALFVAEVAKLAPPITAHDYELSLQAAFPINFVFESASEALPRPYVAERSMLVDFLYSLQSPARTTCPPSVESYIARRWHSLSASMKMEHVMLRLLRRSSMLK